MARRRLSDHQKKRIAEAQTALAEASGAHIDGLVISHHGGKVLVEINDSNLVECAVKSNLGAIVCGDRVVIETHSDDEFRVLAVKPRDNLLQRVDGFGHNKSVAANLSQLIVCLSLKPEPNLYLLDQYLLSAHQQNIAAVILLNKIDLLAENDTDPFYLDSIYAPLGYQLLKISIKQNLGLESLQSVLNQHTSVLSGVSGVGKSSITAALLPNIQIKVGEISEANEEGRHTTRTSRLYHLPAGGDLIDTPGVRGFNPSFDRNQPISAGFREINQLADNCHFANCQHTHEPKCAVLNALKKGDIADSRYQHYLRMLAE